MIHEHTINGRYKIKMLDWQRLPANRSASEPQIETDYVWIPGTPAKGGYPYDYEPNRTYSMEMLLKQGDVLFDVGTADGWLSVIYAQFVGGENVCLFEPSAQAWPGLKQVWEANNLATPRSAFWGFVGKDTQLIPSLPPCNPSEIVGDRDGWPLVAHQEVDVAKLGFRSLLSTANNIPQTTIDDFVLRTEIVPDGISIDVEGAELLVLKGARRTLDLNHPLIWLSLHDLNGALTYDFNSTKDEVFKFLEDCGYQMEWLEDYGDSHWLCK